MMLRPRRELAIAYRIQFAPKRLAAHRDTVLLPKPLHQIDKSPAHDPIEIGNGTFLDRLDKRLALLVVQQRLTALGLASLQTVWAVLVETGNPIAGDLQSDPANRGGLAPRTTFVNY